MQPNRRVKNAAHASVYGWPHLLFSVFMDKMRWEGIILSSGAIAMVPSIRYGYVRGRLLEGSIPGDPGVGSWMITHGRILFGWGMVTEPEYPSNVLKAEYFAPVPPEMDRIAKRRRIQHYQRVRNSREARVIAKRLPDFHDLVKRSDWHPHPEISIGLKVAFEFTREFLEAPRGVITNPPPGAPIIGSHAMPILGVSESQRCFLVANPLRPSWGDKTLDLMPFDLFDNHMFESLVFDYRKPQLPGGDQVAPIRWERPDPLGSVVHGVEIYDPRGDERLSWSFAVHRDGFLDIEELFVRPDYRRRGFGTRLVEMIQGIARLHSLPLRAWVPFADAGSENRHALAAITRKLDLGIHRSGVRWAAYKATQEEPRVISFPFVRIPERPAAPSSLASEVKEVRTLRGTVMNYEDPFGPAVLAEEWEAQD